MKSLSQRRSRPPGQVFNTLQVLGATSLNVPTMTTVRRPAIPRAFDFSGFDTISVYFTVSNMAAGDSLTLRINTLDPESSAGNPIPNQLFARDLITVTANGDYVATLSLPLYYASLGASTTQFLRPDSTITRDAWIDEAGGTVDIQNSINEVVPNDATDVRHSRNLGTVVFGLSDGVDPGVDTGHIIRIRLMVNAQNGNDHIDFTISQGGASFVALAIPANSGVPTPGISPADTQLQLAPVTYVYTMSNAEAALITDYTALRVGWTYYTGFDVGTQVRCEWFEFETPASGGGGGGSSGVGTTALPMYLNLLEFVNTGPTDVTVENCIIELTRS